MCKREVYTHQGASFGCKTEIIPTRVSLSGVKQRITLTRVPLSGVKQVKYHQGASFGCIKVVNTHQGASFGCIIGCYRCTIPTRVSLWVSIVYYTHQGASLGVCTTVGIPPWLCVQRWVYLPGCINPGLSPLLPIGRHLEVPSSR